MLIGPQIPRRGRESTQERYCRAILTLFKPWRTVFDLCYIEESWIDAFYRHEAYLNDNEYFRTIENIELLHECREQRDDHLTQIIDQLPIADTQFSQYMNRNDDSDDDEENNEIAHLLDFYECFATSSCNKNSLYKEDALNSLILSNRFQPCKIVFHDIS